MWGDYIFSKKLSTSYPQCLQVMDKICIGFLRVFWRKYIGDILRVYGGYTSSIWGIYYKNSHLSDNQVFQLVALLSLYPAYLRADICWKPRPCRRLPQDWGVGVDGVSMCHTIPNNLTYWVTYNPLVKYHLY